MVSASGPSGGAAARRVSTEGSGASLEEILADSDAPFLSLDTPMNAYEWLKICLCLPNILWRTLLTAIILPLVWLYMAILTVKLPLNQPLPRWRALLLLPVLRFWGRVLLLLGFFLWPTVTGLENLKEAERLRAIMIFNHVSYLDALIIGSLFSPSGLAKAGVADIPFFGSVARAFQFLFVQRAGTSDPAVGDGNQLRIGSTQAIHARAADPRYPLFAMAPEATTKHSGYLLQFSTGAFVGGQPVIPVLLKYRCRHFDVGWGVIQDTYWHFLRVQSQFVNICHIHLLPPYTPSRAEQKDPRLYADNVRQLMARELGAQLSRYGIPEQQMLKRAGCCVDWTGRKIVQRQSDGKFVEIRMKKRS